MSQNNGMICNFKDINTKIAKLQEQIGSGVIPQTMVEITYSELKSLRDNGQLTPGCWYRITDYETQVASYTYNAQSANHVFDVLVLALTNDSLSEEAFACHSARDTEFLSKFYVIRDGNDFPLIRGTADGEYEGEQYYEYFFFDTPVYLKSLTEPPTVSTIYAFMNGSTPVSISDNPTNMATFESLGFEEVKCSYFNNAKLSAWKLWYKLDNSDWVGDTGKGVIYRMIDEWGNDCPYDFKNIQFKIGANTTAGTVANVYYYTFSKVSGTDDTTVEDFSCYGYYYCCNNKIGEYITGSRRTLNFIVFRNIADANQCYCNIFENNCHNNVFGNDCYGNIFKHECFNNNFGSSCYYNIFGNYCASNTFGNMCYGNIFGNHCSLNVFGNYCCYNTLGSNCRYIKFGGSSAKSYYRQITVANGNAKINLDTSATTSSSNFIQNIHIGLGVNNSNTTKTITHATVNDTFKTTYEATNSVTVNV